MNESVIQAMVFYVTVSLILSQNLYLVQKTIFMTNAMSVNESK